MSRRNNPTVNEQSGYLVFQAKNRFRAYSIPILFFFYRNRYRIYFFRLTNTKTGV